MDSRLNRNKVTVAIGFLLIAWLNRNSPLLTHSLGEFLVCLLMGGLCIWPILRWLWRGMNGVPVLETFCLIHFTYYVSPYLEGNALFLRYPMPVRVSAALAVCLLLASAQVAYFKFSRRSNSSLAVRWTVLRRELPDVNQSGLFWVLLAVWWLFTFAYIYGALTFLGAYVNTVRSSINAAGIAALFFVLLRVGEGRTGPIQQVTAIGLACSAILLNFMTGFLVHGTYFALTALMAFGIGRRRIPVVSLVVALAFISFLQLGKHEMRSRFWDEEGKPTFVVHSPVEVFSHWFDASWRHLNTATQEEISEAGLLNRASLIQMAALVIDETPERRDHLRGETYAQIPLLFVPRFLYPNKPRGSLPTETLGIHYGIQTDESVNTTSISFGHVAESFANFGWFGPVIVGALFGLLFTLPGRLGRALPHNSIGFLLCAMFVTRIFDLENALGTFLVSLFQTLGIALVVLLPLSRPPARVASPAPVFLAQSEPS